MKSSEYIKLGVVWGIASGLLYFLFPEGFNIYHTQSATLVFIPDLIKIIALLPIYLIVTIGTTSNAFVSLGTEPEVIFIIAPIYILISGMIGGAFGYLYSLFEIGD